MTTETIDKLFLELSQITTAQTQKELWLHQRIKELTDLLESARAIAMRKGEDVAWERFAARLGSEGISGITPKVFRVLEGDPNPPKKAAEALAAYFASQYPAVIDHAGRVEQLEDGTWHFYIHPAGANGDTLDLIIGPKSIQLRESNS